RGERRVRAADGPAAPNCAARAGLWTGDGAGPALRSAPAGASSAVHRNLCAGGKRNEVSNFGGGSGGKDLWEGDGVAKVELTYSTTRNINRARPAFGTLVVCIIQVLVSAIYMAPVESTATP